MVLPPQSLTLLLNQPHCSLFLCIFTTFFNIEVTLHSASDHCKVLISHFFFGLLDHMTSRGFFQPKLLFLPAGSEKSFTYFISLVLYAWRFSETSKPALYFFFFLSDFWTGRLTNVILMGMPVKLSKESKYCSFITSHLRKNLCS